MELEKWGREPGFEGVDEVCMVVLVAGNVVRLDVGDVEEDIPPRLVDPAPDLPPLIPAEVLGPRLLNAGTLALFVELRLSLSPIDGLLWAETLLILLELRAMPSSSKSRLPALSELS